MKKNILICCLLLVTFSVASATDYNSQRPQEQERLFSSPVIERDIVRVQELITHDKLRWMFGNCLPNTLDTTVHFRLDDAGLPETFVYTGDIAAMWLRDSGAQVWPYLRYVGEDDHLRQMIEGVIRMQLKQINLDPFANAFLDGPIMSKWAESDETQMLPGV